MAILNGGNVLLRVWRLASGNGVDQCGGIVRFRQETIAAAAMPALDWRSLAGDKVRDEHVFIVCHYDRMFLSASGDCGRRDCGFTIAATSLEKGVNVWLTRTPKLKSSAAQPHGERTPLACGFRRLAENLVPQTISRQNRTKHVRRRFGRAAQTGTRAACATIPISEFGFKARLLNWILLCRGMDNIMFRMEDSPTRLFLLEVNGFR